MATENSNLFSYRKEVGLLDIMKAMLEETKKDSARIKELEIEVGFGEIAREKLEKANSGLMHDCHRMAQIIELLTSQN